MSEHALPDDWTLPPRRETFLARYPRNVKMATTVFLLAILILPPAWVHGRVYRHADNAPNPTQQNTEALPYPTTGSPVETDANAPALNDQDDRNVKLVPAPDSRITQDTAEGSLPRVSEDGLRPWQIYARPFNAADKRPRIAIVITGLGRSRAITDQTITQLPPTVTLAFDAQGPVVGAWIGRARQDGHETLLELPMEPFDYPRSDPGPDTLLTSLPNTDNLDRLTTILRRASGYVGITSTSGSRFTTDSTKLAPVLDTLNQRGLMVLDARSAPHSSLVDLSHNAGVPVAAATQRLDNDLAPEAIMARLDDLEKMARLNGRAVGITASSPLMIAQLQAWLKDLPQRGIALAPITAMVQ